MKEWKGDDDDDDGDDDDDDDDGDDDDGSCRWLLFRRCDSFETNVMPWFIGPRFIRNDLHR